MVLMARLSSTPSVRTCRNNRRQNEKSAFVLVLSNSGDDVFTLGADAELAPPDANA